MCMSVCLNVCMCTVCVQYLWETEEGVWFPGTAITDSCDRPCGFWELTLGTLGDQRVLGTDAASLQSLGGFYLFIYLN